MNLIVSACDPEHPDALTLVQELSAALAAITGDSGASSFSPADARAAGALFVVARSDNGSLLGCAGLRPLLQGVGEIKRMYARPGTKGVGLALLAHLEAHALRFGYRELWLSTRKVNLRALKFYRACGYGQIASFGKYAGRIESVCMGKRLHA